MALTKINSSVIANNTIAVGNIADNSVDATKIASNSILTRHIDDDQITGDQLADALTVVTSVTTPLVDAAIVDGENFKVNGGQGSDGQVLTSTGSGVAWETPSSFNADAAQVFNESGNDVDFRVESNNQTHMLNVDAGSDAVSIGDDTPTTRFSVLTSETNASLHNISNNGMHIGGTGNTNGSLTSSISMGYKSDGAETYKKVALATQGRGDGAARQDFHILVDDAADGGSAEIGNRKFSIDSHTGAVSMLGQAAALIYNASSHTQNAGAAQYTFPTTAYNVGGCYDTSNGRFTATTPGKYLVTCQLGLNASTTAQTYLAMGPRLNDTGTVFFGGWSVKTGTTNQYGAHTQSIVMDLQANDYIVFYIELSATAVVLGGPHYTSISVHKLS